MPSIDPQLQLAGVGAATIQAGGTAVGPETDRFRQAPAGGKGRRDAGGEAVAGAIGIPYRPLAPDGGIAATGEQDAAPLGFGADVERWRRLQIP